MKIESVEIAKHYFKILDNSDYSEMFDWFPDRLTTIEVAYKQAYTKTDYWKFLNWDSVWTRTMKYLKLSKRTEL